MSTSLSGHFVLPTRLSHRKGGDWCSGSAHRCTLTSCIKHAHDSSGNDALFEVSTRNPFRRQSRLPCTIVGLTARTAKHVLFTRSILPNCTLPRPVCAKTLRVTDQHRNSWPKLPLAGTARLRKSISWLHQRREMTCPTIITRPWLPKISPRLVGHLWKTLIIGNDSCIRIQTARHGNSA